MNAKLQKLPVNERIKLVEDLWDSIAADQKVLPLTLAQRVELIEDRILTSARLTMTTKPLNDLREEMRSVRCTPIRGTRTCTWSIGVYD